MTSATPRALFPGVVSGEVREALGAAAAVLASLGHSVEERDPDLGWINNDAVPRFLAGIADHGRHVDRPERLERRTRGIIRMGGALTAGTVRRCRANEDRHRERINRIFDDFDALISPVTGTPAPEIGRWAGRGAVRTLVGIARAFPFTLQWNYTGQPAASIPLPPSSPGGMPRAFQLVVPPNREDLLLSLGAQLERELGWPGWIPEMAR